MKENNTPKKNLISHKELLKIIRGDYKNNPSYSQFYYVDNGGDTIVLLNNIPYYSELNLDTETLQYDLYFNDCSFERILIYDSKIKGLRLFNTKINNDIYFQNCQLESFQIGEATDIKIVEANSTKIRFLNTIQSNINRLQISNASHIDILSIDRCKIRDYNSSGKSEIIQCNINECDIYMSTFTNSYISQIDVFNGSTLNGLRFSDKMIVDSLTIKSGCKVSTLLLNTSHSGKTIVDVAEINTLQIQGCETFLLSINNTIINKLDIQESFIERTQITTNKLQIAEINHSELYALFLQSSYLPKDGYINISNTALNLFEVYSTICSGILILNNIKTIEKTEKLFNQKDGNFIKNADNSFTRKEEEKESRISFSNSDLGKAQFIACDFQLFKRFEYNNSKMLEVFVADTEFPARQNIYPFAKNKTQKLEQQRLALSQFKKIYENRGDNVRATQALAEEMEVYRLQLQKIPFHLPKWYKPMTWLKLYSENKEWWKYLITLECWKSIFTKQWWNNRGERINLWLNKFSNFYGNNWLRGVMTTVIINSLLFWAYSYSLNFRLGTNWEMFRYLIAYSFEFLNPVRKTDILADKFKDYGITLKASPASIAIDYISRIIIAYFVYQTIAAFRKFGKKSG